MNDLSGAFLYVGSEPVRNFKAMSQRNILQRRYQRFSNLNLFTVVRF